MTGRYTPVDPSRLPDLLAADLATIDVPGIALRVAVDGPRSAGPHALADKLAGPLRSLGRPVVRIRSDTFWRDASLRLEHGRTDADAFRNDWLDTAALRREVLDPLGPGGSGVYLPSLRDPRTNRSTRAAREAVPRRAVVIVSGELLLGRDLPFDRTIHLAVTPATRARRTPAEWAWMLPAFDAYDDEIDPVANADVVVRLDDPRHPAISGT
jgi:hypothetical protein